MTNDQRIKAEELLSQGLSYREVEEQTGVPRSTLNRLFPKGDIAGAPQKEKEESTTSSPKDQPLAGAKSTIASQIDPKAVEREHEREMGKISLRRDEIDIERKKLQIQEQQTENATRAIALKEAKEEAKAEKQFEKRSNRKTKVVAEFKTQLKELLDNCIDSVWDRQEVEDYIDDLQNLQERVTKIATEEGADESDLAIYQNIGYLVDFMQEELDEQPGHEIEFDLDRDERRELEALKVFDFDEEYQEEEDDDDSDSQPAKTDLAKQKQYVKEVNGLLEQISEAIDDNEFWDSEDFDEFLSQIHDTKKEVRKLAKSLDLDADSLAIVQALNFLEEQMDACLDAYEKAQGSPKKLAAYYEDCEEEQDDEMIKINLSGDDENTILEDWGIESFDDFADDIEDQ